MEKIQKDKPRKIDIIALIAEFIMKAIFTCLYVYLILNSVIIGTFAYMLFITFLIWGICEICDLWRDFFINFKKLKK